MGPEYRGREGTLAPFVESSARRSSTSESPPPPPSDSPPATPPAILSSSTATAAALDALTEDNASNYISCNLYKKRYFMKINQSMQYHDNGQHCSRERISGADAQTAAAPQDDNFRFDHQRRRQGCNDGAAAGGHGPSAATKRHDMHAAPARAHHCRPCGGGASQRAQHDGVPRPRMPLRSLLKHAVKRAALHSCTLQRPLCLFVPGIGAPALSEIAAGTSAAKASLSPKPHLPRQPGAPGSAAAIWARRAGPLRGRASDLLRICASASSRLCRPLLQQARGGSGRSSCSVGAEFR